MEDVRKRVPVGDAVNYYSHVFYCRNCLDRNPRYIKKGVALDNVAFECDKCGCIVSGGRKEGIISLCDYSNYREGKYSKQKAAEIVKVIQEQGWLFHKFNHQDCRSIDYDVPDDGEIEGIISEILMSYSVKTIGG